MPASEASHVGDAATCTITTAPFACSGTIELSFPAGIASFRSFNGGLADSGFNYTGLALAADVPNPAPAPAPAAAPAPDVVKPALADTGIEPLSLAGGGVLATAGSLRACC
jgi:hypothetical protein